MVEFAKYFVGSVMPYIAALVFVVGIIYRIVRWYQAPVRYEIIVFPAPKGATGVITKLGSEILFFNSLYKTDRTLWTGAWFFHLGLFLILGGHLVGISFLGEQFTLIGLSAETSKHLSEIFGYIAGIIAFVAVIYLLYRRVAIQIVKDLSNPSDYLALLLLILVIFTGNHMRFFTPVEYEVVRNYIVSVLTFNPQPLPDNVFAWHFFFVQLLAIYFPFSKLMHLFGSFVNRAYINKTVPKTATFTVPASVKRITEGV